MAKVATAWVEIRPDMTGFTQELREKLKALKAAPTFKVKIRPDLTGFTKELREKLAATNLSYKLAVDPDTGKLAGGLQNAADSPNVRRAAKTAGDEMADLMAQALRENKEFDRAAKEKAREEARIFNQEWAELLREEKETKRAMEAKAREEAKAYNDAWAAAIREDKDRERAVRDAARNEAREFNETWARALRENKEIDRIAKAQAREFQESWSEAIRKNKEIDRAWNEMLAEAFSENKEFDRKVRDKLRQRAKDQANSWLGGFASALSAVSGGWSKLLANPIGMALIASAGTIAVAFAGAWIGGLVGALAGMGSIGLGALLVKDVDSVRTAAKTLGQTFVNEFKSSATQLVEPFERALAAITTSIPGLADQMSDIFSGLAPSIVGLARSATDAASQLLAGISKGMPGIQAALDSVRTGLPIVAAAIGRFFEKIAEDPEALRKTMDSLFRATRNLIDFLGSSTSTLIQWAAGIQTWTRNAKSALLLIRTASGSDQGDLSNIREAWKRFWSDWSGDSDRAAQKMQEVADANAKMRDNLITNVSKVATNASWLDIEKAIDNVSKRMNVAAEDTAWFRERVVTELAKIQAATTRTNFEIFAKDAAEGFSSVEKSVKDARDAVDDLADAIDVLNGRFIDLQEAQDSFASDTNTLNEDLKERKAVLDGNSQAALDNREALRGLAKDVQDITTATFKQTGSVEQSMGAYNKYRGELVKVAEKFFASKGEAEAYVNQLLRVPSSVLTQMAMMGIPEAQALLAELTKNRTVDVSLALNRNAADSNKPWEKELTDKADWAGGAVGRSFSEGIGGTEDVAKKTGEAIGGALVESLKKAGVIPSEEAGKKTSNSFAWGLASTSSPVDNAASIASSVVAQFTGIDLYASGKSIVDRLARGMNDNKSTATGAASGLAAAIKAFFPNSPADVGPLSGAGDPLKMGRSIADRLATGMLRGENTVETAASTLANAASITPSFYGLTGQSAMGLPGIRQTTNVYIGNEQIDGYIQTRIDEDNEDLARAMLAGRSGV